MQTEKTRLRFDMPVGAGLGQVHCIGRALAATAGVLKAQVDPKAPGIFTVDYDSDATSRETILRAVADAEVAARIFPG